MRFLYMDLVQMYEETHLRKQHLQIDNIIISCYFVLSIMFQANYFIDASSSTLKINCG